MLTAAPAAIPVTKYVSNGVSVTTAAKWKATPKAGWLDRLRIRLVAAEKDEEYEQDDENPPTPKKYGTASCFDPFCFDPFCFRHLETLLSVICSIAAGITSVILYHIMR
ncbi:MAG: hypothetical protein ABSA82_10945 [Thermacetogeniaceae bacterium]